MLAGGVGYGTKRDCLKKEPQKGNKVVVVGGDNYRIGLGGGSVSSVDTGRYSNGIELNAVQRANPEMQKRAYNLVRALCEEDVNPVVSIHDHGSAGHLNCLSELVEECGGEIDMSKLPIGDKTLSSKEIIANESQERMGLLIDEKHIDHVRRIAERERAPLYVVGETTGDAHFSFKQGDGVKPFDLDVAQMFGHSPKTIMRDETVERHYRDAEYTHEETSENGKDDVLDKYVSRVLQLEAVACKDWLTNKVDRSVTGKIARQQCQGEIQLPLSDCGVVALDYRGKKGIATALGHAPQAGLASPEAGSVLSVAEALTNIVWAPLADGLNSLSLSANWMWPCRSQKGEDARLYSAVKALSEFCLALKVNVPTGKDSLSLTQQYPNGEKIIAPGTVIVSAGGEVSDIRKVVSPVIVNDKNSSLYHIDFSFDEQRLGGSAFAQSLGFVGDDVPTVKNPEYFADCFNAVQEMIEKGWIMAGHDISAGGLITTLLEMCFANTEGGMHVNLHNLAGNDIIKMLLAENPGVLFRFRTSTRRSSRSTWRRTASATQRSATPLRQNAPSSSRRTSTHIHSTSTHCATHGTRHRTCSTATRASTDAQQSAATTTRSSRLRCSSTRRSRFARELRHLGCPPHSVGHQGCNHPREGYERRARDGLLALPRRLRREGRDDDRPYHRSRDTRGREHDRLLRWFLQLGRSRFG